MARALRFQANLPDEFSGECVPSVAYLINITPSEVLKRKSPYEVIFDNAPLYGEICIFCCLTYAIITRDMERSLLAEVESMYLLAIPI